MKKGILHTMMALAMVLCLTIALTPPASASAIMLTKDVTLPLQPNIYYVGDIIYYEMTVQNPVGNNATNTLTRIWDTLPDGTVIEFLYEGSPWGNAENGTRLVQAPGESHNFTAEYIVAEDDIEWLVPANPAKPPYWGLKNIFEALGFDSSGDNVRGLTTKNSRVIRPDTEVTIDASAYLVYAGDTVDLTVTEENTGYDELTNPYVEVWKNGVLLTTLNATTPGWSSNIN
ncbi:MAG: hypothetical protein R6V59_04550, partial [Dehalococcoidia bacterium]